MVTRPRAERSAAVKPLVAIATVMEQGQSNIAVSGRCDVRSVGMVI